MAIACAVRDQADAWGAEIDPQGTGFVRVGCAEPLAPLRPFKTAQLQCSEGVVSRVLKQVNPGAAIRIQFVECGVGDDHLVCASPEPERHFVQEFRIEYVDVGVAADLHAILSRNAAQIHRPFGTN